MKSINTLGIAFAVGIIMTLGSAPEAYASEVTNHSGIICKNYNAAEANKIDYLTYGTRSLAPSSTSVICPLIRSTNDRVGAQAYVDIMHTASATTSCTFYSYNRFGRLIGSKSANWTGRGFNEISLDLGSGMGEAWSDYSVLCTIPGNSVGIIMSIDLVEY